MNPNEIVERFDSNVPEDFQIGTLRLLCQTYQDSFNSCSSDYGWPELNYIWGHERRVCFEKNWRELAEDYDNVEAVIESNSNNSFYYTKINCGNVSITASAVDCRQQMVTKAEYRETYARSSQLYLFDNTPPSDDSTLYAILIHSPIEPLNKNGFRGHPAFADFVFPGPDLTSYVQRIRLFDRYPLNVDLDTIETEIVPDNINPQLKKINSRKDGFGTA